MEESFGAFLREIRSKAGLTQAQLAAELGISQPMISGIESGRVIATPRMRILLKRFTDRLHAPAVSSEVIPFDLPKREKEKRIDYISYESWQNSESSGDFSNLYALPGKAVLFACVDVAGRGTSVVPARTFVEGWLKGYLANLSGTPRVEDFAEKLSVTLKEVDFQLSGFFAILSSITSQTVRYEAACFSMPLPLLLLGPPYETRPAAELSPALPAERTEIKVSRIEALPAPWKIIAGSDGLYQRLGGGNEEEGRRRVRKWFTGDEAAKPLGELLGSDVVPFDDEVCAVIEFSSWVLSSGMSTNSLAERHLILGMLRRLIDGDVDPGRKERFLQAVLEAMDNAAGHAYPGRESGPLMTKFRRELAGWRVEVIDEGIGIAPRAVHGEGLKVIETFTSNHFIQLNRGGGTRMTLLLDSKPKSKNEYA